MYRRFAYLSIVGKSAVHLGSKEAPHVNCNPRHCHHDCGVRLEEYHRHGQAHTASTTPACKPQALLVWVSSTVVELAPPGILSGVAPQEAHTALLALHLLTGHLLSLCGGPGLVWVIPRWPGQVA